MDTRGQVHGAYSDTLRPAGRTPLHPTEGYSRLRPGELVPKETHKRRVHIIEMKVHDYCGLKLFFLETLFWGGSMVDQHSSNIFCCHAYTYSCTVKFIGVLISEVDLYTKVCHCTIVPTILALLLHIGRRQ